MIITTAVVLVLVAVHMFFTAVVNVPSSDVKYGPLPGEAADSYVRPLFVQDYRIFAPNPASENRQLWVRAWVEDGSGERTETEWINATGVEIAEAHRRILRKHQTILGAERLMPAYRQLTDEQKEIVSGNFHHEGGREELADALEDDGGAAAFLQASDYVDAYATQVALAIWGEEHTILAVQARVVYAPVIRWADRNDPDAEPPASTYADLGWRELLEYPGQDREEFARTFRAWYESAGEEVTLR